MEGNVRAALAEEETRLVWKPTFNRGFRSSIVASQAPDSVQPADRLRAVLPVGTNRAPL